MPVQRASLQMWQSWAREAQCRADILQGNCSAIGGCGAGSHADRVGYWWLHMELTDHALQERAL